MGRIVTSEVDFEIELSEGIVVEGLARGRVIPPEPGFGVEVADLVIEAQAFARGGKPLGRDLTSAETELLERRATNMLCAL